MTRKKKPKAASQIPALVHKNRNNHFEMKRGTCLLFEFILDNLVSLQTLLHQVASFAGRRRLLFFLYNGLFVLHPGLGQLGFGQLGLQITRLDHLSNNKSLFF